MPAQRTQPDPATSGGGTVTVRRTQAERSAATRARLIEAAIESLHRFGYAATSTTLVADRAGVSRGAMLHHFPTKADLMMAVVQATYDADMAAYALIMETVADPAELYPAVIGAAGDLFRSPAGVAQTELWNATRSDPELAEVLAPLHEALDARTLRSVQGWFRHSAGRDGGEVAQALSLLILAALRGLSLESAFGGSQAHAAAAVRLLQDLARSQLRRVRDGHTTVG